MAEGPFRFAVPLKQLAKRHGCLSKQPRVCESLCQMYGFFRLFDYLRCRTVTDTSSQGAGDRAGRLDCNLAQLFGERARSFRGVQHCLDLVCVELCQTQPEQESTLSRAIIPGTGA